jgi:hypothetical protein
VYLRTETLADTGGGLPRSVVLTDWDEKDLVADLESAGFADSRQQLKVFEESRIITKKDLDGWFSTVKGSIYGVTMSRHFEIKEITTIKNKLVSGVVGAPVPWKKSVAFVSAKQNAE